jgi:hypothetical protein
MPTDQPKAFAKTPSVYSLRRLLDENTSPNTSASRDGKTYVPARPEGFWSWRERARIAWLVFTGRADAVIWPEGQ